MTPDLRVVRIAGTDPLTNLAAEETLFHHAPSQPPILVLWRNAPSIVIGRHQNPWRECDVAAIRADRLPLLRRQSGGGTVYHDLGNTNFSFMAAPERYDQDRGFETIVGALRTIGIDAHRTQRNDIFLGDRKVSGNAFRYTRGRNLHHGTLLVNADLARLTRYLRVPEQRLVAKGIASVRSRVMNLSEARPGLTHDDLWHAIVAAAGDRFGTVSEEEWTLPDGAGAAQFAEVRARLASWEWTFGTTPEFERTLSRRDSWGEVEATVVVRRGRVAAVRVAAGAPSIDLACINETLTGRRYDLGGEHAVAPPERECGDTRTRDVIGWLSAELALEREKGELRR